ncbi:Endosulphine [Penicillium chrysogenum]|nr:Endosulphine [Penicillium chrysogenum]
MPPKGPDPESQPKSDERILSKYGKLPRRGSLARKSKERTYFDSGDFAFLAADRETGNGVVQSGRAHPCRDSISHPYAPVPAASNVNKDANRDPYRKECESRKESASSPNRQK